MKRRLQRGVAVITAMLLTTLAVTLVASLFWRQQVQMRALDNLRLHTQSQWMLRGTLDWARRVLREDVRVSAVDHLDEAWARPMFSRQLGDFLDRQDGAGDAADMAMEGRIVDAQSRFNIMNLAQDGVVNARQLASFERLLSTLGMAPSLAQGIVRAVQDTQAPPAIPAQEGAAMPAAVPPRRARMTRLEDLLQVPGLSVAELARLEPYVVILPVPTLVNCNTASAEVLAATLGRPVGDMAAILASRKSAYFQNKGDLLNRLNGMDTAELDIKSDYFLVYGAVHSPRADLHAQALIYRKTTGNTTVKWVHDD